MRVCLFTGYQKLFVKGQLIFGELFPVNFSHLLPNQIISLRKNKSAFIDNFCMYC
jgi:hypothetical protein